MAELTMAVDELKATIDKRLHSIGDSLADIWSHFAFEFYFILDLDMNTLAQVNWMHDIHWSAFLKDESKYVWSVQN